MKRSIQFEGVGGFLSFRLSYGIVLILFLLIVGTVPLWADAVVDDFDGGGAAAFAGTYAAYGEQNLGQDASQVSTTRAYSPTHSRFLEQTATGGQGWGIVLIKTFSSTVDAGSYAGGSLDLRFFSDQSDAIRTLDVNLVFDDGAGGVADYSLKTTSEPTLASGYNQWSLLSIPLLQSSFDVEDAGPFDLSQLLQIKILIRNNGQGSAARKVYLDDIEFVSPGDTTIPSVSLIAPLMSGEVFPTLTPTIMGYLGDDDSGIDVSSFELSVDGVPQTGALVLPTSYAFTPSTPLNNGQTYSLLVTIDDQAGNMGVTVSTFSVNSTLPPPTNLMNRSLEFGNGTDIANWSKFGASTHENQDPRSGDYHAKLSGNNPGDGSANYSGFYQVLEAAPGEEWQASVFASAAVAFGVGSEAKLQLIYVDGSGNTLPGGVNESATSLDSTTSVGSYTELAAQGVAPAGTEGVKVVLLFIQANDAAGVAYFDDTNISEISLPTGPALPQNSLVDDFDVYQQYHSYNLNDLGHYTDDDSTLATEMVANDVITMGWSSDSYWYTLLADGAASVSLHDNAYLALRYRGHAGGEVFNITLREAEGATATVASETIADTTLHTVNYPLSDFAALGLNLGSIRTLSFGFAAATPGSIDLDGIAISSSRRPDIITLSAPSSVTGGVPFDLTVTVADADGTIADFDGVLQLSASAGTLSPVTISGFSGGSATIQVTLDGAESVVLGVTDIVGAFGEVELDVELPPPPSDLPNYGFEYGDAGVPDDWGHFGESYRTDVDPYSGAYHAMVSGNNPGNGSANYSGFYQVMPAQPGQTWQAAAQVQAATAFGNGARALVQLIYVNAAGVTLPGGLFESSVIDHTTTPGDYTPLVAEGRAPLGTTGAKIVLLFMQQNDAAGMAYFDEALLLNVSPTADADLTDALVDNFDSHSQYHSLNQNDLGCYTDDDLTLATESVENDVLTAGWDADSYWYTLLAAPDSSVNLADNEYLCLRYRGLSGSEAFDISLQESTGFRVTIANQAITDTQMHTVNYPLSLFTEQGLYIPSIRTLSLGFAAATPGTIELDGIAFSSCRHPDTISMSAPASVTGSVPFTVDITVSDQSGVITDFAGSLALSVSDGIVSPSTVSNFVNGVASVQVMVDGAIDVTLMVSDMLGAMDSAILDVTTIPTAPAHVLTGVGSGAIDLTWEATPGVDGYRIYRRVDGLKPNSADLVATLADPGVTNWTDSSAADEETYFYHIAGYNEVGQGPYSEVAIGMHYAQSWAPAPEMVQGLTQISKQDGDRLLLLTQQGEVPFIAGIDIGASIPGHSPGEMAASKELYRKWFSQIAGLGFRAIRVYTLHRPAFYDELYAYNTQNPDAPLYLYHGVWMIQETNFHAEHNLFNSTMMNSFKTEIHDVVGAIHGDLIRTGQENYPGQAIGTYTSDVSPWCAGYIIGIEMEPDPTSASDLLNVNVPDYSGTYFYSAPNSTPTEIWYAEMFDYLATLVAGHGRAAPISTSNYSTTDPLDHPNDPSPYENMVSIDLNHIQSTAAWPAGHFANYHSYPYFPDALRHEDGLTNFVFRGQADGYAGYLRKLKEHHSAGGIPLLISEFGVPSSIGNAHFGPLGRDQGDHSEQEQMQMDVDILDIIRNLHISGGFVFMWQGEWFKTVWNTKDYHIPAGRRSMWQNLWANEANFGLVNGEPGESMAVVVDGDDAEWEDNGSSVIFTGAANDPIQEVRAINDEGFVYLRILTDDPDVWMNGEVTVGLDVLTGGNQGVPNHPGLGVDAEYAVTFGPGGNGQVWVAAWNDYPTIKFGYNDNNWDVNPADVVFESGAWTQQTLIANRKVTLPLTGEQLPAEIFPVGQLHFGTTDPEDPTFDSRNTWFASGNVIEVRLPYAEIGFGDPSQLDAYKVYSDGSVGTVRVDGMGITLVANNTEYPTTGYTWAPWNDVNWHQRVKVDVHVLSEAVIDVNNNHAPEITSTPVTSVPAGSSYEYTVSASDSDLLEMLDYSLAAAPDGMEIDEDSGLITWEPTGVDIGVHTVEVHVVDGVGAIDTQVYTVDVTAYVLHLAYDAQTGVDSFPQTEAVDSNYTGAASIWMTARYLLGEAYTNEQDQIFSVTAHDSEHNGEITASSGADHLNGYVRWDYNFSARTQSTLVDAIADAIYWIDYMPPGGKQAPASMLSGTNWSYKVIRGFQTDSKPYGSGSFTVFGLWLNDPVVGGLGHNIYVPANGFEDIFLPSTTAGSYQLIAEPPPQGLRGNVAEGSKLSSMQLGAAKTSRELAATMAHEFSATALSVSDANLTSRQLTSKTASARAWRAQLAAVLPDAVMLQKDFSDRFANAQNLAWCEVNATSSGDRYVLAAGSDQSGQTIFVVKLNPDDGAVLQVTWGDASCYLPASRDTAVRIAREQIGQMDAALVDAHLEYTPDTCATPFLPHWVVKLSQRDGAIITIQVAQTDADSIGVTRVLDVERRYAREGREMVRGAAPTNLRKSTVSSRQARVEGSVAIYVDCAARSGGNGTSAHPYGSLRETLDAIASCDGLNIQLAPGTYSGEANSGLLIEGDDVAISSSAGPEATVIDCGGAARALHYRGGMGHLLSGVTIRSGRDDVLGGAILCENTGLRIQNCRIESSAATLGGAIYALDSEIEVEDTIVEDNTAGLRGGALHASGDSIVLMDACTIKNNNAGQTGGAMYLYGGSDNVPYVELHDTRLDKNSNPSIDVEGGRVVERNTTARR